MLGAIIGDIAGSRFEWRNHKNKDFDLLMRDCHITDDSVMSLAVCDALLRSKPDYRIMKDGQPVGGVVIKVEEKQGDLELLFVSPKEHSKGIGYAAWNAVEKMHPEVTVWETCTPYFEIRNIHFYVNRCGFKIVEFYNSHHPDPKNTEPEDIGEELFFRFEKVMK